MQGVGSLRAWRVQPLGPFFIVTSLATPRALEVMASDEMTVRADPASVRAPAVRADRVDQGGLSGCPRTSPRKVGR
jgi:hypothetical protein